MTIIIQDIENTGIKREGKFAQNILKLNSTLSKCGYKKAYMTQSKSIIPSTIEDNLTIYFVPSFSCGVTFQESSFGRSSFQALKYHLLSLSGSGRLHYYYTLKRGSFEEQKELSITHEGKKYIVGHYLPLRNIVTFYLPLVYNNWNNTDKNEYFEKILGFIKEMSVDIKEENVEELKEKVFIETFTREIRNKINEYENQVDNAERNLEDYNENIVNCYNRITIGKRAVENLTQMANNIKGSLFEKVKEIRTLNFVESIELTHEGISLEFKKIFIKVKGEDIEMGEYQILLKPNKIEIKNKQSINYMGVIYHSPHIKENQICFGKQNEMANKLLGTMELKKLVHFLYLYLKSYNPEDTYLSMNYWINAKKNGGVYKAEDEDDEVDEYGDDEEEEDEGDY